MTHSDMHPKLDRNMERISETYLQGRENITPILSSVVELSCSFCSDPKAI